MAWEDSERQLNDKSGAEADVVTGDQARTAKTWVHESDQI